MIDPVTLAPLVIQFLLPHLDYLRGKVADGALTEAGKALIQIVKDKWFAKSASAQAAVEDAAANPADADNREALIVQLRKALKADPAFAEELARLSTAAGIQLTITGDNNKTAVVQGPGNSIVIH